MILKVQMQTVGTRQPMLVRLCPVGATVGGDFCQTTFKELESGVLEFTQLQTVPSIRHSSGRGADGMTLLGAVPEVAYSKTSL